MDLAVSEPVASRRMAAHGSAEHGARPLLLVVLGRHHAVLLNGGSELGVEGRDRLEGRGHGMCSKALDDVCSLSSAHVLHYNTNAPSTARDAAPALHASEREGRACGSRTVLVRDLALCIQHSLLRAL